MVTLHVNAYGGWGGWFTVVGTDAQVADYVARRVMVTGSVLVVAEDDDLFAQDAPLTLGALFPSCDHGLSARLCAGPSHYPLDL